MARILVVEDSPTQAAQIAALLENADYETEIATDGAAAMQAVAPRPPDLILTDLHMPNMNGLELVESVRQHYQSIPVVLMTADGTEDIAVEALKKGAASYIPKRFLDNDLLPTVNGIVGMLYDDRSQDGVYTSLLEASSTFVLNNDPQVVDGVAQHFERQLRNMRYTDETGLVRIILALRESLINAIDHGNLELDSRLREDHLERYIQLGNERRQQEPYSSRRVTLVANIAPQQVTFIVRDEGPGFDPADIPDPTDADNLVRTYGRGLMLIQNFMDYVRHNESGNEITMIKRRDPAAADAAAEPSQTVVV